MQDDQDRTAAQPEDDLNLSFEPIDWQQLELLAGLTPAQRGTLRRRFPELSQSELNMKVLAHFTPLRGYEP